MFAVPGWRVPADSLATQVLSSSNQESGGALPHAPVSSPKKRKRGQDQQFVSAQDLERLWSKHFGTSSRKSKKDGKAKASNSTNATHEKSEYVPPTKPELKSAKSLSTIPTAEARGGHIRKRKKAKQEQHTQDLGQAEDLSTELAARTSSTSSGDIESGSLRKMGNSYVSQSAAKVPNASHHTHDVVPPQRPPPPSTMLTPLQAKMRNKLTSARFRHLNQTLYTSSSADALQLFSSSPELFEEYHAGFSQQVKDSWPRNPVDIYIQEIKERGKLQEHASDEKATTKLPLPRRKTGRCTIADLGCGDAPLARGCQSQAKALQLKFHNYDLHAPNSFVVKADIANLPLNNGEVDVAVFCLSLMGTNWIDFVEEAWRVLRGDGKGEVWVAEVKSRFGRVKPQVVENSVGNKKKPKKLKKDKARAGDEDGPVNGEELLADYDQESDQEADTTDISSFVDIFLRRGFSLRQGSIDRTNKMFIRAVFTKTGVPTAGKYRGLKWTGREYENISARHSGRMKFLDEEEEAILPEDEAQVLKPCLYKSR